MQRMPGDRASLPHKARGQMPPLTWKFMTGLMPDIDNICSSAAPSHMRSS